jgi:hypothetical protein
MAAVTSSGSARRTQGGGCLSTERDRIGKGRRHGIIGNCFALCVWDANVQRGRPTASVCLCPQEKPHRLLEWATLITGVLPSETHLYMDGERVRQSLSTQHIDRSLSEQINSDALTLTWYSSKTGKVHARGNSGLSCGLSIQLTAVIGCR